MFLCIRTNGALCEYINCYMNFIVSHELSKMTCGRPYACDDKDDLDMNVDICGSILDVGKKSVQYRNEIFSLERHRNSNARGLRNMPSMGVFAFNRGFVSYRARFYIFISLLPL